MDVRVYISRELYKRYFAFSSTNFKAMEACREMSYNGNKLDQNSIDLNSIDLPRSSWQFWGRQPSKNEENRFNHGKYAKMKLCEKYKPVLVEQTPQFL